MRPRRPSRHSFGRLLVDNMQESNRRSSLPEPRYPLSHRHHHHTRADADSGNNTVIIVAVVCGCVGGVIVLGLLWTLSRRIFRPTAAPLPPVQPLANQRQRSLAQFHQNLEDRKTKTATWFDITDLQPMPSLSGSSASLIPPRRERESSVPSTSSTFFGREDATTPVSEFGEPPLEPDHLPLPNRPFVDHRSSGGSSSQGSSFGSNPPSRQPSLDELRQPPCQDFRQAPPTPPSDNEMQPRPRPRPRPRSRTRGAHSRPQSFASSVGSYSVRPAGAPHRQSRMQIVLPAPLAPELYPFGSEASDDNVSHRRFTMVGEDDDDFRHYRERTVSDAWASPSISRSASRGDGKESPRGLAPRSGLQRQSTGSSTSSSSHTHYRQSRSSSALPPVPSIPSSYASHSVSPLGRTSMGASNEYFDPADVAEVDEDGTGTIRGRDKSSEREAHKLQKTRSKSRRRVERDRSRGRKGRQGTIDSIT